MTDYTLLITSEHSDKPKFVAMVQAVAGSVGDITAALQSLPTAFDLDTAIGAQLDVVGLWVGQTRVVPGVLTVGFFGFSDNVVAATFGEEGNLSIGGRFYEEGDDFTSTSILSDVEYRTILKAKIVRNQSDGTTEDLVNALNYIFNAPSTVTDNGTMSIDINIGRAITLVERSLLTNFDLLPRPAGVKIGTITYS